MVISFYAVIISLCRSTICLYSPRRILLLDISSEPFLRHQILCTFTAIIFHYLSGTLRSKIRLCAQRFLENSAKGNNFLEDKQYYYAPHHNKSEFFTVNFPTLWLTPRWISLNYTALFCCRLRNRLSYFKRSAIINPLWLLQLSNVYWGNLLLSTVKSK